MNVQQLENELWDAADQLRANSRLTAAEYSMPVLGLIFLRHADNRFKAYLPEIAADIPSQVPAAQREELIKLGFQGKAAIYLPEAARFERIVSLPQADDFIIASGTNLSPFGSAGFQNANVSSSRTSVNQPVVMMLELTVAEVGGGAGL